jgi:transposase
VLYIAGIVQLRNDTPGRACYRRKLQQSKTSMEAMRCLRRRLSDAVYRQLVTDAAARLQRATADEPAGHPGAALPASPAAPNTPAAPAAATSRRRARGVNVERPTGRTTLTPISAGAHSTAPGPRT